MSAHEQTDVFGGSVPLEELDLAGHSRRLAVAERERGHALTAVEAGQLVHAARGKHPVDEVCAFCGEDGTAQLVTLAAHRGRTKERERKAAEDPPWTCPDCQHENPAEATHCRGCGGWQDDDREPVVTLQTPRGEGEGPADAPDRSQPGLNTPQVPV